ncbi:uncharacterized protein LOC120651007 [Panicum virgatum]|uniref:uncharacterized protein LOC120651007 n=1 Tax=Panicum virgatum TaxID=38727 RepID=UPI0019D6144B|nr:uncharacterized protein LOC120651007 [Panicum virgatum]
MILPSFPAGGGSSSVALRWPWADMISACPSCRRRQLQRHLKSAWPSPSGAALLWPWAGSARQTRLEVGEKRGWETIEIRSDLAGVRLNQVRPPERLIVAMSE